VEINQQTPSWAMEDTMATSDYKEIKLVDGGQDFTEWVINDAGVVVDAQPFQADIWIGTVVHNHNTLSKGDILRCTLPFGARGMVSLNYPVASVGEPKEEYEFWQYPDSKEKRDACAGKLVA